MIININQRQYYVFLLIVVLFLCLGSGCVPVYNDKDISEREAKSLKVAYGFLQLGHYQKVIARLNRIIKNNKYSFEAYGLLGVVYQRQGEYMLSEESFHNALAINASAAYIRNDYGSMLLETGRYESAREQFEIVSKDRYYNNRSLGFENLGFVALKLNQTDVAENNFLRAVRLEPSLTSSLFELTRIYDKTKQRRKAFDYYLQYDRVGEKSAASLFLGFNVARNIGGDKAEALMKSCSEALKNLFPNSVEYKIYRDRFYVH